jgi:hypothetical protein
LKELALVLASSEVQLSVLSLLLFVISLQLLLEVILLVPPPQMGQHVFQPVLQTLIQ